MYHANPAVGVPSEQAFKEFQATESAHAALRLRCSGAARIIVERCKPCRCTGQWKQSYLWHNYRPLRDKMEEIIMNLVKDMKEASTIVVTATAAIIRFVESEHIPLCKDQFLRMISVAVCVNAKFWDDEQAGRIQNERIASVNSIPLDEFNMMEIAFMRGLGWNLHLSEAQFGAWVAALEHDEAQADEASQASTEEASSSAEEAASSGSEEVHEQVHEQVLQLIRRNPSPHSSTDLVDGIESMISDFKVVSFGTEMEGRKLELASGEQNKTTTLLIVEATTAT